MLPPLKSEEMPVTLTMPGGSLTERGRAVLDAAGRGEIGVSQASQLVGALAGLARVAEMDELLARIEALEEARHGKS